MAAFNRPQGQSDGNGALIRLAIANEAAYLARIANATLITDYGVLSTVLSAGHVTRICSDASVTNKNDGSADYRELGVRTAALVVSHAAARIAANAHCIRGIRCIEGIRSAQREGISLFCMLEPSVRVVVENTLRDAGVAALAAALKAAGGALTENELTALARKVTYEEFNYLGVGYV